MGLKNLKALALPQPTRGRGLSAFQDWRRRSPKDLDDWGGIIFPSVVSPGYSGSQNLNYDSLDALYVCHDLVWTCINAISSTVAQGKLSVREKDDQSIIYRPDHPLQSVLDFPNGSMTQFDFIQSYITHQLLYGKACNLLLRENVANAFQNATASGDPDEYLNCFNLLGMGDTSPIVMIMPVHPHHIISENGKNYYTPTNNKRFYIHPNNVMYDPFYNPALGGIGVSPTHILAKWLNLDTQMVQDFLTRQENGGIPSMIVNMKPPQANQTYDTDPNEAMNNMAEKWDGRFGKNGNRKKRPAFLYGDIDVKPIEDKVDATGAKQIFYEIQGRITSTYGVPADYFELGMRYGSQRATAEQSQKTFFNKTINPYLIRIKDKLNNLVSPSYPANTIYVDWDLTNMGLASFIEDARKAEILKEWELGITTRNETRRALKKPDVDDEYGSDYYRLDVVGNSSQNGSNSNTLPSNDNRLKIPQDAD